MSGKDSIPVVLNEENLGPVYGGLEAIPASAIAGGIIVDASCPAGRGTSLTGSATAALYVAIGGAMTASVVGLGIQLFGGFFGASSDYLASEVPKKLAE